MGNNLKPEDISSLKFRYLLWMYKTVKEDIDRVERKFTQLDIDKRMNMYLSEKIAVLADCDKPGLAKPLEEFKKYIKNKEQEANGAKAGSEYKFLLLKFEALEKAAIEELGQNALREIKALYEEEMQSRILNSREHN